MLHYEVESWNPSGESFLWVRMPTLTPSGEFTAYWGDSGLTAPPYRTDGSVWNNDFRGVWHLKETTSATRADATGNGNTLNPQNNPTLAAATWLNGVNQFNGSNQRLVAGAFNSLDVNSGTLSIWFKAEATQKATARLISLFTSGNERGGLYIDGDMKLRLLMRRANMSIVDVASTAVVNDDVWRHAWVTYDSGGVAFYLDGTLEYSAAGDYALTLSENPAARLADYAVANGYEFKGLLDEARISSAVRSTDWLWAERSSVLENEPFLIYGEVEAMFAGTIFRLR